MAKILMPEYLGGHVMAAIRSLSRQGDECDVAWNRFGWPSRFIKHYRKITPSSENDHQYILDIIELCSKFSYDLLMPFGNNSYYAFAKHKKLLAGHARFMVPDFEIFTIAHDKFKTAEFCRTIGIETPSVFTNYSDNDIPAISRELKYPVVIKAKSGSGVKQGLRYANSREELFRFYDEISSQETKSQSFNYASPIIQEFTPGYIHDACTLTDHGKVINVLTQVRLLMNPIYGGVGAVNVTTHEPDLARLARRILERLPWHGPAQIEFKFDNRDRKYKLIEINPKLWGTLDLSIQAGMNFPAMIRDLLVGRSVQENKPYDAGIRYKFLFPQATFAYLQQMKEFGPLSLLDKSHYLQTVSELCFSDLLFQSRRIYSVIFSLLRNGWHSSNSNLPKKYINTLEHKDIDASFMITPPPDGSAI